MRQSKGRGNDGAQSTLGTSTDADRALADCVTKPASPPPGSLLTNGLTQCPLRSESDRSAALPRIDGMCQFRPYAVQQKTPVAVGTMRARSLNPLQSEAGLMQDRIQIDETLLHRTARTIHCGPNR
jgi:hypothetical protein